MNGPVTDKNTTAADLIDVPVTDNENATVADRRDATAADSRDATAADCRYCPVTDNKNATAVGKRDDADTDTRDNRVSDSKKATNADLSHAVTNGCTSSKGFTVRTLNLSCYYLSIFPSHKTTNFWDLFYKFLFLYILSLCLRFHLRLLLILSEFLVSADLYCSEAQVVCVREFKLRPFQYIPFSLWIMYF